MQPMFSLVLTGYVTSLALIFAIGAQNAFVLRQGLRQEHVLPVVLLCASSDVLLILAGIAGLGLLIEQFPLLLAITLYGGAAFVLAYGAFAAYRAWRGEHMHVDESQGSTLKQALLTCLAFTYLNPHVYLDASILLGGLANQQGPQGRWFFGLGACLASFSWFFALGFGAKLLRPVFENPLAWRILDSLIAVVMAVIGFKLMGLV
jgi:L-lysine exporter family protein LysE/ArgO